MKGQKMSKTYAFILLVLKRVMSRFPSPLPVGKSQYDKFEGDILDLSGRYADETSMRFAIASIMIHASSDKGSLSKKYFVDRLRKSAANQIASQVFQDIKNAQEAQKASVEVTAVKTADVKE
jgi:hypothetical protein